MYFVINNIGLIINFLYFLWENISRRTNGFIGCIGDLYIGDDLQNLNTMAAAFSGVRSGCGQACSFRPCEHNTSCVGNYSDFSCSCINTLWTGRTCQAREL